MGQFEPFDTFTRIAKADINKRRGQKVARCTVVIRSKGRGK